MASTWAKVDLPKHDEFAATSMLLLTEGSALCEQDTSENWFLAPDDHGDHVNGTSTVASSTRTPRLYCASAVLGDGRAFVAGGYAPKGGDHTSAVGICNPPTNTWFPEAARPGWPKIGDAPCAVPADGPALFGNIRLDRTANKTSKVYRPHIDAWLNAGSTQVDLVAHDFNADGRVIAFGDDGHTAIYTPCGNLTTQGSEQPVRTSPTSTRPPPVAARALARDRVGRQEPSSRTTSCGNGGSAVCPKRSATNGLDGRGAEMTP